METDVSASLTKLEFLVSGSVFAMDKEASEIVFETRSGIMTTRALVESLAPGLSVYGNIIDIWSVILNDEQQMDGESVSRLFLQTSTISSNMLDGTLSFEQAYTIFDENMRSALADNEELLSLKNIETVFFPIVSFEHYYLVVFKLRRVAFNIIDNNATCSDYDVKYKAVCSVVHRLFSQYLTTHGHAKASSIRRAKPSILKMKWRTRNNSVDCGVFLMCHMDTYLGQPLSRWDPGFVSEDTTGKVTQTLKLNKLRGKYCTKILLHDNNIHKSKMLAYAKAFEEKYDIRARKKLFDDAISCHIHVVRV